jgi:DNA-directed RNA polymerase subunit K/omega
MGDFGGFEIDVDEEEVFEETPEIDQPEFEEIFQSDIGDIDLRRRREGVDRISKPFLGKLAKARLIAARSEQLQLGAPPVIPPNRLRSSELQEIALQEFDERVIPIKIIRKFADGTYEIWSINDFRYFVRDIGRSQRSRQRKFIQTT